MDKEIKRWQTGAVKEALSLRRVVHISGARQTGKTTLTKQVIPDSGSYRTLDDTDMLNFALSDPKGFIANPGKTMVIDEIQKAPNLVSEIKIAVDKNKEPGQYLLTGSANLLTLPRISESLAGRVKYIRLRPFSMGEILEKEPSFIQRAYKGDFPEIISGYDKAALIKHAFCGGYPEVVALSNSNHRKDWHRDYIVALIERDLLDVSHIRRKDILSNLVGILSSWSAKYMELSSISSSLAIHKTTLENYIHALISMFLFDRLAPWIKTDYERVGRRSKIYAADTGIMASLLGWKEEDVFMSEDRSGKLIETFVYQELLAQIELLGNYTITHYRDRNNREIDFVIENEEGEILGIEVKSSHSVSRGDFKSQEWFKEHIHKSKKSYTGIILYSGDRVIRFSDTLSAVPSAALWL